MKRTITVSVAVIFILIFSNSLRAEDIRFTVSCPDYPPFFYEKDGIIAGQGYEIAKAVIQNSGFSATYRIMPWKRVYILGQKKNNFMIVGIGRTPKREKLFQWICPINKGVDFNFIMLKSNPINVNSLEDIKKYKTVVIRGSHMHDFLIDNGFPDSQIHDITSLELALKFLNGKRADFYLDYLDFSKPGMASYKKAYFAYKLKNYISLSNNASKDVVQKLRDSYQKLNESGKIVFNE